LYDGKKMKEKEEGPALIKEYILRGVRVASQCMLFPHPGRKLGARLRVRLFITEAGGTINRRRINESQILFLILFPCDDEITLLHTLATPPHRD
jgi:hypothetical protein